MVFIRKGGREGKKGMREEGREGRKREGGQSNEAMIWRL